jgi:hypothetical protein
MTDVGLVSVLLVYAAWAARRAIRGPAPLAPIRLTRLAAGCLLIHFGFHTAATAAPTVASAIALVLTGWLTFGLWWKWTSRAPMTRRRSGPDDSDDGGGGPGDGPPPSDPPGPSGDEVDWDAFDRQFADYVEKSEQRRLAPD